MENLKSYLKKSGTRQAEMAKAIGISRSYLSEIVSGGKIPSLEVAAKIEAQTNGVVLATSFVPLEGVN